MARGDPHLAHVSDEVPAFCGSASALHAKLGQRQYTGNVSIDD
jgi:hypothetical protein